jgi:NAD(P)-dependent dehydrogenase (short-subunit alcohol dehydrogenase family)
MHNSPRTWFITSAISPIAVRLIRLLLAHGDYVAAGLPPFEIEDDNRSSEFRELINECKSGRKDREGWKDRIRGLRCDGRIMGQCGAAVAEAVELFGRIDILLCCTSEGNTFFDSHVLYILTKGSCCGYSRRTINHRFNAESRPRSV